MSASFMSYVVQIIPIYFSWILQQTIAFMSEQFL
jgi:hypothetical protein